jgi:hypothetical protein
MSRGKLYYDNENLVSYFSAHIYNGIDDLAETIMNPANCRSYAVNISTKDNFNFAQPEHVYVYTDIIKPNLVGDSYVRLLTSLHFPSKTGYRRFDSAFYKRVEQYFRVKFDWSSYENWRNMLFEVSGISCRVILHIKKMSLA